MSKFANAIPPNNMQSRGPLVTATPTLSHEGGKALRLDAKSALFTRAVTAMCEPKFYDNTVAVGDLAAATRVATGEDAEWVRGFVPYLRNTMNMRSASIVVAAEYAAAKGEGSRSVISAACLRADEPAEMLAYWISNHGRRIPAGVKRGIADACVRLYNQYTALKYDGQSRPVRMADVINLTHPKPADDTQAALFKFLLDRRHGNQEPDLSALDQIRRDAKLLATPEAKRRAKMTTKRLKKAGWTWERLAGWVPGGMDAEAWEAIIPTMGYMALIRNLRNFEGAGISSDVLDAVAARIADPRQVALSRQFPYRFYSAWKFSGTMRFGPALEAAMDHSLKNVPDLPGRTLIMVDTSGSMQGATSQRSKISHVEVAAVFGAALAASSSGAELAIYADGVAKANDLPKSVLRSAEKLNQAIGVVGHGTNTWPATMAAYEGHDRIVVLTDMQDHPSRHPDLPDVPIYVWDLAGYGKANINTGAGRHLLSGFTDAHFRMIPILEQGRDQTWPWLADA